VLSLACSVDIDPPMPSREPATVALPRMAPAMTRSVWSGGRRPIGGPTGSNHADRLSSRWHTGRPGARRGHRRPGAAVVGSRGRRARPRDGRRSREL